MELKKKASILFGIRFDDDMYETLKEQLDKIYEGRDLVSHTIIFLRLTQTSIFIFFVYLFNPFFSQTQDMALHM